MTIHKTVNGTSLGVALEGRLDTTTAPQLEAELKSSLSGVTQLAFDFAELQYISSAGLRVLLSTQKVMNHQGTMVVRNANETILEVFEDTGFIDILTVEEFWQDGSECRVLRCASNDPDDPASCSGQCGAVFTG